MWEEGRIRELEREIWGLEGKVRELERDVEYLRVENERLTKRCWEAEDLLRN